MLDADPEDLRFSFFPLALRAPEGLEEGVLQLGVFETDTESFKMESLETELFKAESLVAGMVLRAVLVEAWGAVEEGRLLVPDAGS